MIESVFFDLRKPLFSVITPSVLKPGEGFSFSAGKSGANEFYGGIYLHKYLINITFAA